MYDNVIDDTSITYMKYDRSLMPLCCLVEYIEYEGILPYYTDLDKKKKVYLYNTKEGFKTFKNTNYKQLLQNKSEIVKFSLKKYIYPINEPTFSIEEVFDYEKNTKTSSYIQYQRNDMDKWEVGSKKTETYIGPLEFYTNFNNTDKIFIYNLDTKYKVYKSLDEFKKK